MTNSLPRSATVSSPLLLLLRVNALQTWRRLKSLRRQSGLLTSVIALFVAGYFVLAFGLFYMGLRFLGTFPGLGELLVERLLYLLFAFLFAMLLLSNLVIGYTNLFRNRETAFLWTLPVAAESIFRWKFVETTLLASWAFVFLISPLLLAYGLTQRADWHFYVVTPLMIGLFVVLPGVLGAWLAIHLARFLDRRVFQAALVTTVLLMFAAAALWLKPQPVSDDLTETRMVAVVDRLLVKTQFAQFAFLPSYWLSAAVLGWAEGARAAAGFFALVLTSNVLLFGFVSFTRLGGIFYDAASTVQSRGHFFGQWEWFRQWRGRRRQFDFAPGGLERLFGLCRWVRPDAQAMLVKDVRTFWRDTTQWGQTLMLFGLLGVYIINLRQFTQQLTLPFWVHLVSFLNLGTCSLNLATLTTRFVFPQFSLEGRRLWIIGMAPMGLARMVRVKFWLASSASLVVTLSLVWLSCHLLKLPWERTLFFSAAVTIMTFTLNAMAVGLGALYPNFKEDNPGKIVSGFGGTLCLVLSFVYILCAVVLLAYGSPWFRLGRRTPEAMMASWLCFVLISLALGGFPLRWGLRKVKTFEI